MVSIPSLGLVAATDAAGDYVLAPSSAGHPHRRLRLRPPRRDHGHGGGRRRPDGAGRRAGRSRDIASPRSITVVSASRRAERITEAPAAISVVPREEIERQASHGQLPKLLEFTPGAEVTQSGVYDFNFNTRGFNSSLNRRVADADRRPRPVGAVPRLAGVGVGLLPARRPGSRPSWCAARPRRSTAPTPRAACST